MEVISDIWNLIIIQPMINSLVVLYSFLANNFGLSIIVFTLIVRIILVPLTIKQANQMKLMGTLQPKLKELQEKYSDDKAKASQETMKVYREHGINPIGCLGPMFIQFPIWIGLYQAILQTVPPQPESLIGLSNHLYSWLPRVHQVIPLDSNFLWLNLALPDKLPVFPILVAVSMWIMQKMTTMPSADPRQASTNKMMLWMMPLMFGFFTTTFPSGLALYWVVSNVVGVLIQGFVTGWAPLTSISFRRNQANTTSTPPIITSGEEKTTNGRDRNDRQDDRRSDRNRSTGTRRRSRRSRNKRR